MVHPLLKAEDTCTDSERTRNEDKPLEDGKVLGATCLYVVADEANKYNHADDSRSGLL